MELINKSVFRQFNFPSLRENDRVSINQRWENYIASKRKPEASDSQRIESYNVFIVGFRRMVDNLNICLDDDRDARIRILLKPIADQLSEETVWVMNLRPRNDLDRRRLSEIQDNAVLINQRVEMAESALLAQQMKKGAYVGGACGFLASYVTYGTSLAFCLFSAGFGAIAGGVAERRWLLIRRSEMLLTDIVRSQEEEGLGHDGSSRPSLSENSRVFDGGDISINYV
ncbi:MAG: hypothetical protein ACE365_04035 [Gammaproteobacteria bacterium]